MNATINLFHANGAIAFRVEEVQQAGGKVPVLFIQASNVTVSVDLPEEAVLKLKAELAKVGAA